MSRGAVASGWCPKHDRIYAGQKGGRCPECGTALVAVTEGAIDPDESLRAKPRVEPEEILAGDTEGAAAGPAPAPAQPPQWRNPWVARGLIAGGLFGAFVLGLVFPRIGTGDRPGAPGTAVDRTDKVGVASRTAAGSIILDKLVQKGRSFEADFLVEDGFDPLLILGVSAEISTRGAGGQLSSFGLGDVEVRTLINGFKLLGQLEAADERVARVRLTSMQLQTESSLEWKADIGRIWPTAISAEPRVMRLDAARTVGRGSVRLTALLGWSDRLEAVFELKQLSQGNTGRYELGEVDIRATRSDSPVGQAPFGGSFTQITPTQHIARFDALIPQARVVWIRCKVLQFLIGPWAWDVP